MQMSPLCQQLLDLAIVHDIPNKGELVDMLSLSELEGKLSISGLSLLLGTTKVLAGVLPACRHLTSEGEGGTGLLQLLGTTRVQVGVLPVLVIVLPECRHLTREGEGGERTRGLGLPASLQARHKSQVMEWGGQF